MRHLKKKSPPFTPGLTVLPPPRTRATAAVKNATDIQQAADAAFAARSAVTDAAVLAACNLKDRYGPTGPIGTSMAPTPIPDLPGQDPRPPVRFPPGTPNDAGSGGPDHDRAYPSTFPNTRAGTRQRQQQLFRSGYYWSQGAPLDVEQYVEWLANSLQGPYDGKHDHLQKLKFALADDTLPGFLKF